jgi:hypothetical protein
MMNAPYGAPYTLDQAFPFVKDTLVAFDFSCILFQSDNGFGKLLAQQIAGDSDLAEKLSFNLTLRNCEIVEISRFGHLPLPRLCISFVAKQVSSAMSWAELSVGAVIQAVIRAGLRIVGVLVSGEPDLDIPRRFSKGNVTLCCGGLMHYMLRKESIA